MSKVFLQRGPFYNLTEGNFNVSPTLDDGIYTIHANPMNGELFLERIGDKFEFGFKLYGLDETLVKHVLTTYNKQATKHNIGVLLNGAKGTGKTVTAKYLANKLGLPVIICDTPYPGLAGFLSSIDHDCVFFFDEFEKNFRVSTNSGEEEAGENLLSIMDGVYSRNNCHIFLLTTNELRINDNLICRPSRIKYLKSFSDVISKDVLNEFLDDNLNNKEYKEEIVEFVSGLEIATIDIVKSIVDEINIHDCHIDEFKRFFNVKESRYRYSARRWWVDVDGNGIVRDDVTKDRFITQCKRPWDYFNKEELSKEDAWRPTYCSVQSVKAFNKLAVGNVFFGTYIVKEIDKKENYVFVIDASNPTRGGHFYIENPDATPSIYGDDRLIYAYGDYDYYD